MKEAQMSKNRRGDGIKIQFGTRFGSQDPNVLALDIRQTYTSDDDQVLPTKKGINVSDALIPDFLRNLCSVLTDEHKAVLAEVLTVPETGKKARKGQEAEAVA